MWTGLQCRALTLTIAVISSPYCFTVEHKLCRYEDAAKLKVRLGDLTKEAEAAAAKAAEERSGSNNRAFRLGQRVVHARDSYRAVVCG